MKYELQNHSDMPTWYVERMIEFVVHCNDGLKNEPFPDRVRIRCYNGQWHGYCIRVSKEIAIYFTRHWTHLHEEDSRWKIQRVKIDVRNRTENFLFLLAHEMRHLLEFNEKALWSLKDGIRKKRRVWLCETDANAFAQTCVHLYRGVNSSEHFRDFLRHARMWYKEVREQKILWEIERRKREAEYQKQRQEEREREQARIRKELGVEELPDQKEREGVDITLSNVFDIFRKMKR